MDRASHRAFVKKLEARAGQPPDMLDLRKDHAMDVVFAVTFGRDFNYIEQGDVLIVVVVVVD